MVEVIIEDTNKNMSTLFGSRLVFFSLRFDYVNDCGQDVFLIHCDKVWFDGWLKTEFVEIFKATRSGYCL